MRKTYAFTSAVLVLTALAGCQNNGFTEDTYIPENGEIVFRLANGAKTTKGSKATVKGATVDLGTFDGTNLFLEESITYLDQVAGSPETKGTPAYTENFTALYGDFKAAAFKTSGGNYESAAFDDGVFEKLDDKEMWKRKYAELKENLPLYFFLRAPYDNEGDAPASGKTPEAGVVSGLDYNTSTGAISFSYTSPATATAQKDLLFTSREVTSAEYADFIDRGKGIPVLFHHALTGVKFAIANPEGGFNDGKSHNIAITKVEFRGLANTGSCVITPRQETEGYVDDRTDYSSGGTNKTTVWTLGEGTGTFSQEFGTSDLITYTQGTGNEFSSKGEYPESFAKAGNVNNLNDGDATKTFWFIPQAMTANVKLTVTFKIDGTEQDPVTINFGTILSNVTWEAGELRTYTIRIDEVNVKIEDTVDMAEASIETLKDEHGNEFDAISYRGSKKENVVISNTGNTDAYIRAAIIGQWLDQDGNPVFGFTDYTTQDVALVDSWYQDQFGENAQHKHGEFTGLTGYDSSYSGDWVLGNDGYYYYPNVVKAGESIPADDPLFTSYTVLAPPAVKVAGGVRNVYFQLEIATQAISAKKMDGTTWATYTEAWNNAKKQ